MQESSAEYQFAEVLIVRNQDAFFIDGPIEYGLVVRLTHGLCHHNNIASSGAKMLCHSSTYTLVHNEIHGTVLQAETARGKISSCSKHQAA